MNPVLNEGIQGIHNGLYMLQKSAQRIAILSNDSAADPIDEIAKGSIELIQSEIQVKASAEVIKTVDETLGTTIDLMA